ncbi:uncharacterized protein LOC124148783 [Haliotis rufescens]|uniref:uncharacterized protein LOC124148783 n=1 Tax=Haliotis rufescens TaxID=6454 RepID=UPI00201F7934|nr:uncharacterized protein LOC124148783 [Haliotis rufescens]
MMNYPRDNAFSKQSLITELSVKADKLFRLGKRMRLSDAAIINCSRKALQRSISNRTLFGRHMDVVCSVIHYLRSLRFSTVVAVAVLGLMTIVVCCDVIPPSMEESLSGLEYKVARLARLFMEPYLPTTGADEYIQAECAVPNPLYRDHTDCGRCSGVTQATLLHGVAQHDNTDSIVGLDMNDDDGKDTSQGAETATENDVEENKEITFEYILLHKDSASSVHVSDMMAVLGEHEGVLANTTMDCSPVGAIPLKDFFTHSFYSNFQTEKLSCTWKSKLNLAVAMLMRKMFPRPKLLPPESEVAPQKFIYVDGPGTGGRKMNEGFADFIYTWYVQGQGERTLKFSPPLECRNACRDIHVTVMEGDTLIFPGNLWDVHLLANKKSTSLAFEGYMYI